MIDRSDPMSEQASADPYSGSSLVPTGRLVGGLLVSGETKPNPFPQLFKLAGIISGPVRCDDFDVQASVRQ
jgi:hypothetical protein